VAEIEPARIACASCPLCGDAVILDLREANCTRHRCGLDVIAGKR